MNNKKELIKNTFIIAVGKCSTQVITFLLLPLYTSILSTSEYGVYDFISTVTLCLVPCITLLMEEGMFRFLIEAKDEKERKIIITQSVIFITLSSSIYIILIYILLYILHYTYRLYLVLYVLSGIFNVLSQAFSRGLGKIKIYSLAGFISSACNISLNILLLVILRVGIKGMLSAYIISNILTSIWVFNKLKIINYINLKELNKIKLKRMVKYSVPLVPNSISWVIINLSDRVVITSVLGSSANGIYAVANKFPSIINTFYGFFYTAWQESASKVINNGDYKEYYESIYLAMKRFLMAISIGLISIMPFIFKLLVNRNYENAYMYIPALIISIFFSNISGFYGGIFVAYKDTKIMGKTTIIAAIINLSVTILFIKYIGVYAAMLSTFISNFVVYAYRRIKIKEYIIFEVKKSEEIKALIIISIITLCYYSSNINLYIIGFIIAITYAILINKENIEGISKIIKNLFKEKNIK